MAIISPLAYTIANGDPVDATPVQANLSQIVQDVNANAAPVAGSASQQFLVATTANPAGAVPLAQAQSQFAAISGSSSQAFNVASGSGGTLAIPLSQIQAQFAALNGNSAQAFSVAAAASGSTQAPQIAQTVGAGASGYVDQTSNRVNGVTYTNSTGRPLFVFASIAFVVNAGDFGGFTITLGGLPYLEHLQTNATSGSLTLSSIVSFLVPSGMTYSYKNQANATSIGLYSWLEY